MRSAAVERRLDALFQAMSSDFLLREQFVTDPAQILTEYLQGSGLAPERATATNHLIYSIVSSPDLLRWVQAYAVGLRQRSVTRPEMVADFARAVTDTGSNQVVLSLAMGAVSQEATLDVGLLQDTLQALGRQAFLAGTEMSTGTQFGTELSGTMISSPQVLENAGTEMSTGTQFGTEQSGTMMSTGAPLEQLGFLASEHVQVTMRALVEHATRLRDAGALDELWDD